MISARATNSAWRVPYTLSQLLKQPQRVVTSGTVGPAKPGEA